MKILTEEHKNNIRKSMLGHNVSIKTKAKMSIAQKGLQTGNKNGRWKGGRSQLKSGYVLICLSENSPFISMTRNRDNCILEHRLVVAQHLERCLETWELVHHINHVKNDNRIENLVIIDGKKHFGFHHQITLLLKRLKILEGSKMTLNNDIEDLIEELEKEMNACSPDKYGYVESDVYKKVILLLKALVK